METDLASADARDEFVCMLQERVAVLEDTNPKYPSTFRTIQQNHWLVRMCLRSWPECFKEREVLASAFFKALDHISRAPPDPHAFTVLYDCHHQPGAGHTIYEAYIVSDVQEVTAGAIGAAFQRAWGSIILDHGGNTVELIRANLHLDSIFGLVKGNTIFYQHILGGEVAQDDGVPLEATEINSLMPTLTWDTISIPRPAIAHPQVLNLFGDFFSPDVRHN